MKDIVLSCDNLLKQYPVKKGMFNKVVGQKNIVDHVSLELERARHLQSSESRAVARRC